MTPALHPGIDVAAATAAFAATGHVRLSPFIDEASATALLVEARAREDWMQIVNSGNKVFELSREVRAAMAPAQTAALDAAVNRGARDGFQHRYEALRLPDGNAGADVATGLSQWPRWLSGEPVRSFLQKVTGQPDIEFADGQATAYGPGDFLTGHDDSVASKQRRAAYVFGLNPVWRIEWGGLLLFHNGNSVRGVSPTWNSIDLFAVPQMHSVSMVTAATLCRRYSITGWLRAASVA